MKLIRLILVVLTFGISTAAISQPVFKQYPDSIRVEFPDLQAIVVFELRDYPHADTLVRYFPRALNGVLDNIRRSTNDPEKSQPMKVEVSTTPEGMKEVGLSSKPFGEKQLITITPITTPKTSLTILKDKGIVELLPPGWEVYMRSKEYQIKVYASTFQKLDSISTQDFSKIADGITQDAGMKTIGRKNIEAHMVVRDNQPQQKTVNYVFPGDHIYMGFQGGIGIVNGTLYPELSLRVGLSFKDRYRRHNFRTFVTASRLFFVQSETSGFKAVDNSFLSFSIEKNFNRKSAQPSWSGIGVGFLIRKDSPYFQGNTAKLFITHSIPNSRFTLAPEFYLTDDFKKFTFGMTLRYAF